MPSRMLDAAARLDTVVGRRVVRALVGGDRVLDRAAEALAVVLIALGVAAARLVRAAVADVALPLLLAAHRLAQQHVLPPSASVAAASAPPRRGLGVRALGLASAVVLVTGIGAVSTASAPAPPARAVTAAAQEAVRSPLLVDDSTDVGPARPEARAMPPEPVPSTALPAFEPPRTEPTPAPEPAAPRTRWLPTGTGMWLHDWERSEDGDAARLVERSLAVGLTHVFVQTGSTKKGWIGEEVLSELLPATEGTGLAVVAWDFPKLIDPEADARRMAQAAQWSRPGLPRVAAVAPDVETAAEGTHLTPDAVTRYYAELRRNLPPEVAVLATVPWPSEKRTSWYPYAETALHSDAFVPMAYWYNRSPAVVTQTSMEWLAQFGKPVMPVGQGYDGRIDAPYLPEDPDPAGSVQAFVDAARAGGAASISLWSWQTTGAPQWGVLAGAGQLPWTAAPAPLVPEPVTGAPVG